MQDSGIKSLVKGEAVKIRYYDWPQYDKFDQTIMNTNFAFIYNRASEQFGWKNFGIPEKLAPVKLDIYIPTDPDLKGYARVNVNGNRDLVLVKNFDKHGGGAYIEVGVEQTFGLHKGRWICKAVALGGGKYLIVRNSEGDVVFKEELPKHYDTTVTGETWPVGERAALASWKCAPLGSIEIEGSYQKRVLLYGFKELQEGQGQTFIIQLQ